MDLFERKEEGENIHKNYKLKYMFFILQEIFHNCFFCSSKGVVDLETDTNRCKYPRNPGGDSIKRG